MAEEAATSSTINEYSYEEEQTSRSASRRIKLRLTDNAIEKAAPLFNGQFPLHRNSSQVVPLNSQRPILEEVPESENLLPEPVDEPASVSAASSDNQDQAHRFFEVDNDQLVIKEVDFKGNARKSQLQRFLAMYVWGYDRIFKAPVPSKEHLMEATKRASLFDGNFAAYLRDSIKTHFVSLESGFKLNTAGTALVQKVIAEMDDPNIKGFAYWESGKANSKRGGTRHKADNQKIQEWVNKPSQAPDFDIRTLKTTADCAMFGIWSITKDLKVENAVTPADTFAYLTKRFQTIPFAHKEFTTTLSRNYNEDKFKRTSEGTYYLTVDAERIVEGWISGNPRQESAGSTVGVEQVSDGE